MQKSLSVSEFLRVVNNLLGGAVAVIEGEVSQFSISQGRWVFFTLKDQEAEAAVECFMMAYELKTPLENGMLVKVSGRPGVHTRSGRFRITVRQVEPVGEGALARALALLKAKLEQEGLFNEGRKRALPFAPELIAVIASRESAAYTDFIKVLTHRFGGLTILLRHVLVEGPAATGDITKAFSEIVALEKLPEVVVLTRGGGSLESLAAFNSESVARAIFSCPVPVVVGVGHERDVTLADLVADVRASTPSNAAELLVPERQALREKLTYLANRQSEILMQMMADEALRLDGFDRASGHFLEQTRERVVNLSNRLTTAISWLLKTQKPDEAVARLWQGMREAYRAARDFARAAEKMLENLSPKAVLARGYAIAKNKATGEIVKSVKLTRTNDELELVLQDGQLTALVK